MPYETATHRCFKFMDCFECKKTSGVGYERYGTKLHIEKLLSGPQKKLGVNQQEDDNKNYKDLREFVENSTYDVTRCVIIEDAHRSGSY